MREYIPHIRQKIVVNLAIYEHFLEILVGRPFLFQ